MGNVGAKLFARSAPAVPDQNYKLSPKGNDVVMIQPAPGEVLLGEVDGVKMYMGNDGRVFWTRNDSPQRLYHEPSELDGKAAATAPISVRERTEPVTPRRRLSSSDSSREERRSPSRSPSRTGSASGSPTRSGSRSRRINDVDAGQNARPDASFPRRNRRSSRDETKDKPRVTPESSPHGSRRSLDTGTSASVAPVVVESAAPAPQAESPKRLTLTPSKSKLLPPLVVTKDSSTSSMSSRKSLNTKPVLPPQQCPPPQDSTRTASRTFSLEEDALPPNMVSSPSEQDIRSSNNSLRRNERSHTESSKRFERHLVGEVPPELLSSSSRNALRSPRISNASSTDASPRASKTQLSPSRTSLSSSLHGDASSPKLAG